MIKQHLSEETIEALQSIKAKRNRVRRTQQTLSSLQIYNTEVDSQLANMSLTCRETMADIVVGEIRSRINNTRILDTELFDMIVDVGSFVR